MGTVSFHKPKGVKAIDAIKGQFSDEWWNKRVIASTATREAVFLVVKSYEPDSKVYVPDADGFIRLLAIQKITMNPRDHYNFSYKEMTETMGPVGCEAPMSILAQCSELKPLIGDQDGMLAWATKYRARSTQLAALKAFKRSLKPGDKVTLREGLNFSGCLYQRFTVSRGRVRGRTGVSTLFRADDGLYCNITSRHLEGATVES